MKYFQINRYSKEIYHLYRKNFKDSIQKRLGYSENTKLLIIHADDMGLASSENAATIKAMEKGMVNSGSLMVPCPKYHEIIDYCKTNPTADVGVHLTVTSEWEAYKWGPVLPPNQVPSLVNDKGFFFETCLDVHRNFREKDIESEYRAQINLVLKSGIDITHLDSHMGIAFSHPRILKIYFELGREFKLPVLLNNEILFTPGNIIHVDQLYFAMPERIEKGFSTYYRNVLNSIKPGLNCILLHIAYDNKEMQEITNNQPNWGSIWRQKDFDFFTSDECNQLIANNNIQLITWREIRDKLLL